MGCILLILLPLVRATNDMFLFLRVTAALSISAEAQIQQVSQRNWRQKSHIYSLSNY